MSKDKRRYTLHIYIPSRYGSSRYIRVHSVQVHSIRVHSIRVHSIQAECDGGRGWERGGGFERLSCCSGCLPLDLSRAGEQQYPWSRKCGVKIALLDNPREMMLPSSSGRGSWASSNSCPGGEGVDNLEERQWGTNYSSLQPLLLHAQSLVNSCLKHLNCSCLTLPSLNLTSPKPLHWWTRSFVYCPWFLLLCWCVHLEPLLLFDQINDSVTSKAQRVPNTWCFRFNFFIDSCDEALLHSQCTIFFSSRLSGLVFLPCFYSYLYICSWLCWTWRDDFIQFNCVSTHISFHIFTFFSW